MSYTQAFEFAALPMADAGHPLTYSYRQPVRILLPEFKYKASYD
jgi:hypothetical protein